MPEPFERILLIKMSSMGDILHALPTACAWRDRFPKAHISWLIDERYVPFIQGHRAVDEIIPARAPAWVNRVQIRQDIARGFFQFSALPKVRGRRFDCVVDLQGLLRTALFAKATGAPTRVGFRSAREGATLFYTHSVSSSESHIVRHYLSTVEAFTGPVRDVRFDVPSNPENVESAGQFLRANGIDAEQPFAVIAPKSSRPFKDWSPSRFAEIINHLWRNWSLPSVLIGGRQDRKVIGRIIRDTGPKTTSMLDSSLGSLIGLLQKSRIVVGLDSGPSHLAAALGKPVVVIFGPTSPERYAPWGTPHLAVSWKEDCRACHFPMSIPHGLPGIRHTCLEDLAASMVINRIDTELSLSREAA